MKMPLVTRYTRYCAIRICISVLRLKRLHSYPIACGDEQLAAKMLHEVYAVPDEKIDVIPHGVPDLPFMDPNYYKISLAQKQIGSAYFRIAVS